jgi:hypothetical protein
VSTDQKQRAPRLRPRVVWPLGLMLALVLGVFAVGPGRMWLHRIDSEWFGERVMDTLTLVRSHEDWSSAEPLRPGQNYRWLKSNGVPIRIAHALGESGLPTANTLGAMRRSYQAGFRIFEVDLVLEEDELRCKHDPGQQTRMVRDGCTFEALMTNLPRDSFVVLDIKSEFAAVGRRVLEKVKGNADARRVVFQLYRPEDFARFNVWQRQAELPGPILSAYLAHRRIGHVADQVARLGVRALTVSLDRLPALNVRPAGAILLVHPVHDCESWAAVIGAGADGAYALSSLECGELFKANHP